MSSADTVNIVVKPIERGLDVERLARALFMGDPGWHGEWAELLPEDMEIFRDRARDIASEYESVPPERGRGEGVAP